MEFKKSLLAAAVLSAMFGIAGCSDDDNDNDNNNDGADNGGQTDTSSFNGSLKNEDFHPLEAEIGDTITAAGTADCPAGQNFAMAVDGESGDNATTFTIGGEAFPVCYITDDIDSDVTLTNDHVYVLSGNIKVGNGGVQGATEGSGNSAAILTIEKGTMIFGDNGTNTLLRVTRDSDINVNGTADEPVVMSAVDFDLGSGSISEGADPLDVSGRGEWGGVIIDGWATVNGGDSSTELKSEAAPTNDDDVYYGGNTDDDSSGSIEYLVIAESGVAFRPDQEVQGLTLEGVGSGTTIEYLQVLGSEDDGIEWFGGSVDMSHVVINGADDDALDMDQGWNGTLQHAIVRMGEGEGDNGIESDSKDGSGPRVTQPTVANLLILGNKGKGESVAAKHRENFQGKFYNVAYLDDSINGGNFTGGIFEIDDAGTEPTYTDSIWNSTADALYDSSGDQAGKDAATNGMTKDTGAQVNATTFAVTSTEDDPSTDTITGDNGTDITLGGYYGAVDPTAGSAWWDGWTAHVKND